MDKRAWSQFGAANQLLQAIGVKPDGDIKDVKIDGFDAHNCISTAHKLLECALKCMCTDVEFMEELEDIVQQLDALMHPLETSDEDFEDTSGYFPTTGDTFNNPVFDDPNFVPADCPTDILNPKSVKKALGF